MFHDPGPPWLDNAHRAAEALQATTRKARGAGHSVYVVLLHDARRAEPWGLYVGQTSRDPDLGGIRGQGIHSPHRRLPGAFPKKCHRSLGPWSDRSSEAGSRPPTPAGGARPRRGSAGAVSADPARPQGKLAAMIPRLGLPAASPPA